MKAIDWLIIALVGTLALLLVGIFDLEVDLEEPLPTAIEWGACSSACAGDGRQAYDLTYSLAGWRCRCIDLDAGEEV